MVQKRTLSVWGLVLSVTPLLVACNSAAPGLDPSPATENVSVAPTNQMVHQITLPHDDPDFPPGNGREIFISRCTVCHSLRYVTMQPDFPKKTWSKEVAKMINSYGAHINGKEAQQIIEYLATIKGTDGKQQTTQK